MARFKLDKTPEGKSKPVQLKHIDLLRAIMLSEKIPYNKEDPLLRVLVYNLTEDEVNELTCQISDTL